MVKVVRAGDRELIARVEAVRSMVVPVDGAVLLGAWRALNAAIEHLQLRDAANAAVHMEAVKSSPLTLSLIEARNQLQEILREAAPKTDPTSSAREQQPGGDNKP